MKKVTFSHLADASQTVLDGVAVVTDCASPLGNAIAVELSRRGMRVVGFLPPVLAATQPVSTDRDKRYESMAVDVSDEAALTAAFASIKQQIGDVTILVNNLDPQVPWEFVRETPARFLKLVSANLAGAVCCMHGALKLMVNSGSGRIITISSDADMPSRPIGPATAATRAGIRALSQTIAADFADRFPNIVLSEWTPKMAHEDPAALAKSAGIVASLALWHDRTLNGVAFEGAREVVGHRPLFARIGDKLLFRRQARPRMLSPTAGMAASTQLEAPQ